MSARRRTHVERIGNEDRVRLAREPALLAWLRVAGAGPAVDWVARYAVARFGAWLDAVVRVFRAVQPA
jgi:hypothetical protein